MVTPATIEPRDADGDGAGGCPHGVRRLAARGRRAGPLPRAAAALRPSRRTGDLRPDPYVPALEHPDEHAHRLDRLWRRPDCCGSRDRRRRRGPRCARRHRRHAVDRPAPPRHDRRCGGLRRGRSGRVDAPRVRRPDAEGVGAATRTSRCSSASDRPRTSTGSWPVPPCRPSPTSTSGPCSSTPRSATATGQPGSPLDETFWVAQSDGATSAATSWKIDDGSYRVVVMNADGSPGVDVEGSLSVRVPVLGVLAVSGLAGGGLLLVDRRVPAGRRSASRRVDACSADVCRVAAGRARAHSGRVISAHTEHRAAGRGREHPGAAVGGG